MIRSSRLAVAVVAALIFAACQSAEPETPTQALESIIHLYKVRDYDALIRTRYAEIAKAEGEEQIELLVDRFETRYEDMTEYALALSTYREALQVEPELTENGSVATYRLDGRSIKLSKMPNGKWGFHL